MYICVYQRFIYFYISSPNDNLSSFYGIFCFGLVMVLLAVGKRDADNACGGWGNYIINNLQGLSGNRSD